MELAQSLLTAFFSDHGNVWRFKRIFTGFKPFFSLSQLITHLEEKKRQYQSVSRLCEKKELSQILEDLFRVGVVGNNYSETGRQGEKRWRNRWSFRGDDQILLEKRIAIHRGLLPVFSLV